MTTTTKATRDPDPRTPARKPLAPVTMSRSTSSASRAPPSPAPPLTPRVPSQRNSSSSSSLSHANAATRSPRPIASTRKLKDQYATSEVGSTSGRLPRADIQARVSGSTVGTSGRASPALSSVGSTVGRDRSSAGSTIGRTPSTSISTATSSVGCSRTAPSSPMFFHASSVKQAPTTPTPRAPRVTPSGVNLNNKFFHANQAPPPARTSTPGPTLAPPRPSSTHPRDSLSNHPRDNASNHPRDSASNHPLDPPSLPLATPEREPRSVRFVYANGTCADNELPASSISHKQPSELSSGSSSTTHTFSPSEVGYSSRPSLSPHHSSLGPSAMPPPLSPPTSASRRSSIESKARHNRAVSVSSISDVYERSPSTVGEITTGGLKMAPNHPLLQAQAGLAITPQVPRPTFAQREEAAALARRERKVLDLEISNASLLAINKTLEKKMRKQLGELRRFRRLSRSGKLQTLAQENDKSNNRDSMATIVPADLDADNDDIHSADDGSELDDFSSEEEEEDEDDGTPADPDAPPVKDRVHDEKRLASDLKKHQALLDASIQMNLSLRRCQLVTEQLINEGKKALEYKVPDSELKLGGRILRDEDDEDGGVDLDDNEEEGEHKADFHFLGRESSESGSDDEEDETGDDVDGSEEEEDEHGESSFVASSLDGLSEEDSSMLDSSGVEDEEGRY